MFMLACKGRPCGGDSLWSVRRICTDMWVFHGYVGGYSCWVYTIASLASIIIVAKFELSFEGEKEKEEELILGET